MRDREELNQAANFIRDHRDLLNADKLQELYIRARMRDDVAEADVTYLLNKCGINPLTYLEKVPNAYLFFDEDIEVLNIPNHITSIGEQAFSNCPNLKSVTIPGSVATIEWGAFADDDSLTTVSIGEGVTKLEAYAFEDCPLLSSINLPDSIKTIEAYVFVNCESLKSVALPNKLTKVDYRCFSKCINLEQISIPETVTLISGFAFEFCEKLATIKYAGTKLQWIHVAKAENWDYHTGEIKIICSDGELFK